MYLPTALILGVDATTRLVDSARPDAPVVPYVEPPQRIRSVRLALSKSFHRAARAIAPPECSPAP